MGEHEALQEKIARLTRERDEMATQASACAEEVDRSRVEIGAVRAEVERLTQVCASLADDLRSAEMDRDDARRGEDIWARRCGVVIGRSRMPDVPADAGRLAAETMWRANGASDARWEDHPPESRQIWALVEAACVLRARSEINATHVIAADIRRAWSHMREICGLVATSACRDELIRQTERQAKARVVGESVPPPSRPNRAALFDRSGEGR